MFGLFLSGTACGADLPLDRAGKAPDASAMFVRCKKRFKDGEEHRCWSAVENVRGRGGRVVQRHVLYLGEINDSQRGIRHNAPS